MAALRSAASRIALARLARQIDSAQISLVQRRSNEAGPMALSRTASWRAPSALPIRDTAFSAVLPGRGVRQDRIGQVSSMAQIDPGRLDLRQISRAQNGAG